MIIHIIFVCVDGSQFVTAGKDTAVRVYDEATKSEILCMKGKYIQYCIFYLFYHLFHYIKLSLQNVLNDNLMIMFSIQINDEIRLRYIIIIKY